MIKVGGQIALALLLWWLQAAILPKFELSNGLFMVIVPALIIFSLRALPAQLILFSGLTGLLFDSISPLRFGIITLSLIVYCYLLLATQQRFSGPKLLWAILMIVPGVILFDGTFILAGGDFFLLLADLLVTLFISTLGMIIFSHYIFRPDANIIKNKL